MRSFFANCVSKGSSSTVGHSLLVLLLLGSGVCNIRADVITNANAVAAQALDSSYSVTEKGAHHRVWKRVLAQTNDAGQITQQTNSYTQIGTGLNHWVAGQWVASSEDIQLTQEGAAATNGSHQVYFAANVNTAGGIRLVAAEGWQMRSHVVGLSYFDTATSNNVMIAETQDSIGQILPSLNQVLYTNAFTDLEADIRYTYSKGSFEQDIIFRQQPPAPAAYGLNPQTTRLQVWTEFIEAPKPRGGLSRTNVKTGLINQDLSFGTMRMIQGKAFTIGKENFSLSVAKRWNVTAGRTFLVEELPFKAVATQLQALPAPTPSGNATPGTPVTPPATNGTSSLLNLPQKNAALASVHRVSDHLVLPAAKTPRKSTSVMKLAGGFNRQSGVVLDYQIIDGSLTNFTFRADNTYSITGAVYISQNAILEGGTVIKYAPGAQLMINDAITCKTGPYRPAIFTAQDDDSVGNVIGGSTGTPSGYYGSPALCFNGDAISLQYLKINYAESGLYYQGIYYQSSVPTVISHSQFGNCDFAFLLNDGSSAQLHNCLFYNDDTVIATGDNVINADHLTVAHCGNLTMDWDVQDSILTLTNSLLVDVTNWGVVGESFGTITTNYTATNASSSSVFQQMAAGYYYLATNSVYRSAGTTNIDAQTLTDLRRMTTYPPLYLTNFISSDTVLGPQAARDTNASLDLGFHYAPLDYIGSCTVSNATLTLTNGVVLAYTNGPLFSLNNNAKLISTGTALQRNYLVFYPYAQEQPNKLWSGSSYLFDLYHTNHSVPPSLYLNFTTASLSASIYSITDDNGFQDYDFTFYNLNSCEMFAAGAGLTVYSLNGSVNFTNCLLHEFGTLNITPSTASTMINNLFYSGSSNSMNVQIYGNLTLYNNVFDTYRAYINGTRGNSAYLNGAIYYGLQSSDVVTNLAWVSGPLGDFYQPTNSPLIGVGSTQASFLGLYDYTVTTNEVPETTNIVSLGYHYVALDGGNLPIDVNSNGVPDYLENPYGEVLPYISGQPLDQTVYQGNQALFTVTASAPPSLTYQWYFGGTAIAGGTQATLWLTNVLFTQQGGYSAVVSDAAGSVTSRVANLTVLRNQCLNAPTGIVSWWPGNSNLNDMIGTNNVTSAGGVTYMPQAQVGPAFSLDGTSGYLSATASATLDVGSSAGLSIECWINPGDVSSSSGHPLVEWNNGSTNGVCLWILGGSNTFSINLKDSLGVSHVLNAPVNLLNPGVFQHLAATYDQASGVATLYYNGVLVASQTLGSFTPQTSYNLYLGTRPGSGLFYQGVMDEVSLYSRALQGSEVASIYNASFLGKCRDSDGHGLSDAWQYRYFGQLGVSPTNDADVDGLNNLQEYQMGTDPTNADTDGDGHTDWQEVYDGTDPLNPASKATWAIVADQPYIAPTGPGTSSLNLLLTTNSGGNYYFALNPAAAPTNVFFDLYGGPSIFSSAYIWLSQMKVGAQYKLIQTGYSSYFDFAYPQVAPAGWLAQHFGAGYETNSSATSFADPNGNGLNNGQEYLYGTDPLATQTFNIWVGNPGGFLGIP